MSMPHLCWFYKTCLSSIWIPLHICHPPSAGSGGCTCDLPLAKNSTYCSSIVFSLFLHYFSLSQSPCIKGDQVPKFSYKGRFSHYSNAQSTTTDFLSAVLFYWQLPAFIQAAPVPSQLASIINQGLSRPPNSLTHGLSS